MNKAKADFFDSEVESEWSAKDYGSDDREKINRILEAGAVSLGAKVIEPGC